MRTELIRDLLLHIDADGSFQVGDCPDASSRTLEEMRLPLDFKRTLQWNWTNRGGEVGPYTLYSVEDALANEDLPKLSNANMFPIGCAENGDPLVALTIEGKCSVGLVSHDRFWEDNADPLEVYAEVAGSIDELLWRAMEGRYLPVDFYAASELLAMKNEISGVLNDGD